MLNKTKGTAEAEREQYKQYEMTGKRGQRTERTKRSKGELKSQRGGNTKGNREERGKKVQNLEEQKRTFTV